MRILKSIEKIDWDFPGAWTGEAVHDFHWFPAKLVPQIPSTLISHLTTEGDRILDPFCGSGTTLVEAIRLGRLAVGVDFHPLACLIAKAKTTFLEPAFLRQRVVDLCGRVEALLPYVRSTSLQDRVYLAEVEGQIPDFPGRERWFHIDVLRELALIQSQIDIEENPDLRQLFLVCFSANLKRCSSQKSHWGYVADNMVPAADKVVYEDAYALFKGRLLTMTKRLCEFLEECSSSGVSIDELNQRCQVFCADARDLSFLSPSSFDFVMTSPPYASVTDYVRAHRLSFYWFGYEMRKFEQQEIGARWKRFRKNAIHNYSDELKEAFGQIHVVMKPGAIFCALVGKPSKRTRKQDLVSLVERIAQRDCGFGLMPTRITRRPSRQRLGAKSVKEEEILFFQKI